MEDNAAVTSSQRIITLPADVVNKIAAGEVVQRPFNAVKELLENSLDAQSTNVMIAVKNGGLSAIQITDDGKGIVKDDLKIICERHTTSKLSKYEDLQTIKSYGFRGEALASLSHCSHLTITTKVADSLCAFSAKYSDGKLSGSIRGCAGNNGTVIQIDDLFYNVPIRKSALRSAAEEHRKIEEVIRRYAVHNPNVGFCLKKLGSVPVCLRTPSKSTTKENIGILVSNELLEISGEDREQLDYEFSGYCTNPNYSCRQFVLLLFVNNRLVDSMELRQSIRLTYFAYLPKGANPFVYLNIQIPGDRIDVNVHPTKEEVKFLNETEIFTKISERIEQVLLTCNQSRTLRPAQPTLPIQQLPLNETSEAKKLEERDDNGAVVRKTESEKRDYDYKLIRTDHKSQKLDSFVERLDSSGGPLALKSLEEHDLMDIETVPSCSTTTIGTKADDGEVEKSKPSISYHVSSNPDASAVGKEINREIVPETPKCTTIIEKGHPLSPTENPPLMKKTKLRTDENIVDKELDRGNLSRKKSIPPNLMDVLHEIEMDEEPPSGAGAVEHRECRLTSVAELRLEVGERSSPFLRDMMREHTFVGCVNPDQSLIQYRTGLYMINTRKLMEELVYQMVLFRFGNFGKLELNVAGGKKIPSKNENDSQQAEPFSADAAGVDGIDLNALLEHGTDMKKEAVDEGVALLVEKAPLLLDYFSIKITDDGYLKTLPHIISEYDPQISGLALFVKELINNVNWTKEKICLQEISRCLGRFYAFKAKWVDNDDDDKNQRKAGDEDESSSDDWKALIEDLVLPTFRAKLLPPAATGSDGTILKLTDLHDLYKVFERC